MAKQLGGGKATGTVTGAKKSQRLMGGASSMSSTSALAGRSITPPALRVSARTLDTYARPGQVTLGGPTQLFAPPPLPDNSGDLVRLSKALGGLQPALGEWAEVSLQQKQADIQETAEEARATANLLTQMYPGQDLVTVRDAIEKRVKAEDKQAIITFNHLQAQSPLHMTYVNRYMEGAIMRNDIDTALTRFDQLQNVGGFTEGEDGKQSQVPLEMLPPDDPRFIAAMTKLFRLPSDPVVMKEFESSLYAKYAEITQQQAANHTAWKTREFVHMAEKFMTTGLASTSLDANQLATTVSALTTDARRVLGTTGFQSFIELIPGQLAASVVQLSSTRVKLSNGVTQGSNEPIPKDVTVVEKGIVDTTQFKKLADKALESFSSITAGPNGELLKNRINKESGVSLEIELTTTMMSEFNTLKLNDEKLDSNLGNQLADKIIKSSKLNSEEIYKNPTTKSEAIKNAFALLSQDPLLIKNPEALDAAKKRIVDKANAFEDLFSDPVQNSLKDKASEIVNDPMTSNDAKRTALDKLVMEGLTNTNARTFYNEVDKDSKLGDHSYKDIANSKIKKLKKIYENIDTNRGEIFSEDNVNFFSDLQSERNANRKRILNKTKPEGKSDEDWSQELASELRKTDFEIIQKYEDQLIKMKDESHNLPAVLADLPTDTSKYKISSTQRTRINQAVKAGQKVVSTPRFEGELDTLVKTNSLSNHMITTIRHAGYLKRNKKGFRPGDYFIKQWKVHYPGADMPKKVLDSLTGLNVNFKKEGAKWLKGRATLVNTSSTDNTTDNLRSATDDTTSDNIASNELESGGSWEFGKRFTERLVLNMVSSKLSSVEAVVGRLLPGGAPVHAHETITVKNSKGKEVKVPVRTPAAIDGDHGALFSVIRTGESTLGSNPFININDGIKSDLTDMTIKEVLAWQETQPGKDRAAGALQIVKDTLNDAVKYGYAEGITEDTVFNRATQEKLFWGLLLNGRDDSAKWLLGEVPKDDMKSLKAAQMQVAKLWASVARWDTGESYYKGVGNNKAHIPADKIFDALIAARESITGEHFNPHSINWR